MPLVRVGYGIVTVGMVACAAIIAVSLVGTKHTDNPILIPSVLGFAASTIMGVISVLVKLEELDKGVSNVHSLVNGQRDLLMSELERLRLRVRILQTCCESHHPMFVDEVSKIIPLAGKAKGMGPEPPG